MNTHSQLLTRGLRPFRRPLGPFLRQRFAAAALLIAAASAAATPPKPIASPTTAATRA